MVNIEILGTVNKCPSRSMVAQGANPEFYEFALLPLPLDFDRIYLQSQKHWFPLMQVTICYDMNGLPVLAVEKQENNDQIFGITRKAKNDSNDSTGSKKQNKD